MEIWKDIQGFENQYQISNFGRVKSLSRHWKPQETILIPQKSLHGYLKVKLGKGTNNYKEFKIHRLVAIHFILNPFNLKEVNHKDGNKFNNNYWNLEWTTRSKNMSHAFANRLVSNIGQSNPNCKLTEEIVRNILIDYSKGFDMFYIISKYNISKSNYNNIIHRRTWKNIII